MPSSRRRCLARAASSRHVRRHRSPRGLRVRMGARARLLDRGRVRSRFPSYRRGVRRHRIEYRLSLHDRRLGLAFAVGPRRDRRCCRDCHRQLLRDPIVVVRSRRCCHNPLSGRTRLLHTGQRYRRHRKPRTSLRKSRRILLRRHHDTVSISRLRRRPASS